MSKIENTSKVSLKFPNRINLGRRGVRAELSTLDPAHKLPHNLKRIKILYIFTLMGLIPKPMLTFVMDIRCRAPRKAILKVKSI